MPAYIAFGANLGDPPATYRAVESRLSRLPSIQSMRSSPLYRTTPVGGPAGQADYFNGAFEVQTSSTPPALYQHLRQIQREFGRPERSHWQPRTIDLDLVLFDSHVLESPDLVVPHPRAHHRWFVLRPLVDLAPDALHPVLRRTARELLEFLQTSDPTIYIVGDGDAADLNRVREWIARRWTSSGRLRSFPLPHSLSPPSPRSASQRCPVSSRDVHFLDLAASVVAAEFPNPATQAVADESTIWFVVVEAVESRPPQASQPCWPAVDLRAESLDGSLRRLNDFLESRLPGVPAERKQE